MKKSHYYFLLSLFLHLLLLLSFILSLSFPVIYKAKSEDSQRYVPAYIYHPPTPMTQAQSSQSTIQQQKQNPTSPQGIEKSVTKHEIQPISQFNPMNLFSLPSPSMSASSRMQIQRFKSEKNIDDALLQILYEATAANLVYPQVAVAFNRKGLVRIRFVIHPNGRVTNVMLITSCGFDPLDKAGLDAIHAISPIRNAKFHLDKPKPIVAEIQFS